jgi:predicted thioesterase
MGIDVGLTAGLVHTVGVEDTARFVGSGDLDVLATPRLLALAEAATVAALDDAVSSGPSGRTTVGTRVQLEHLRPTAVGETVTVAAALRHVDGRLLRFEVVVTDDADRLVGRVEVTRVVVDRSEFLGRARG